MAGVLEPHAAQNYNVPAAATQAIQSPAGGQESLWRKETRGGKGRVERRRDTRGGVKRSVRKDSHRRVRERKRQRGRGHGPTWLQSGAGWVGVRTKLCGAVRREAGAREQQGG